MQADAMKARFGNYGTPNPAHASGLYSIPLDTLHDRCTFDYSPVASAFPSFIMNHFANNTAYDAFKGTDYTPHNLEHYPTHSHWRNGLKPQLADHSAVGGALCDLPPSSSGDDGGLHHTIMRVGPFTSNGGYDWWQYAGHDTLSLSRHLEGGASIGIGSHWVTAVEAHSGRVLGYPPMHVHHIHLVPSKPWLRYQWATPSTGGWRDLLRHLTTEQGAAYYVPNYVMEQHGEWDLCDIGAPPRRGAAGAGAGGGGSASANAACHAESLPAGYLNLIDFPLDFEGELNDGRAVGAPDLTWYLEIGLGWTSRTRDAKPLSYARARLRNLPHAYACALCAHVCSLRHMHAPHAQVCGAHGGPLWDGRWPPDHVRELPLGAHRRRVGQLLCREDARGTLLPPTPCAPRRKKGAAAHRAACSYAHARHMLTCFALP